MSDQSVSPRKFHIDSVIISFVVCSLIVAWNLHTSPKFEHWFLIPVALSGFVVTIDAVNWFMGRLSIFDPVGIIGLLSFHFFFTAPILHVSWDQWLEPWFQYPPDWRPWLGGMAIFNLLGLIVYRFCLNLVPLKSHNPSGQTVWQINQKRFKLVVNAAMAVSAVLQINVYRQFGGVMGYINSANSAATGAEEVDKFQGMGIVFLVSESFPILAMMAFAVWAKQNKRLQSWPVLLIALVIFIVLQMFFGGLRGSRANTIWALFWAAGIIHFWIRPITKKDIALGLVFLVCFMYIYGFFKAGGVEAVQKAFSGEEARAQMEEESGRTWQGMLLGDLGRSDVQAFMLHRSMRPNSDHEYAWGQTYVAASTILIPSALMPHKPERNKTMEGTELLFGKGSYIPGQWHSSKIYGLTGEAMLNFGPFVMPFMFIPFAILIGWVQSCLFSWHSSDSRLLLLPMLVNFCFVVLVSDLDNDIFFLMKNSGFPTLVVWLSSQKKFVPNNLGNLQAISTKKLSQLRDVRRKLKSQN
ncbi:MAG: hypothetical protein VKL59_07010 [Nostocaceae cyanobacterium]|nr:hypothetical protein [Nostocaceae cyanobacterium]